MCLPEGVAILNLYSINMNVLSSVQRGSQVRFPSDEKQCMYLPEGVASLICYDACVCLLSKFELVVDPLFIPSILMGFHGLQSPLQPLVDLSRS